MSRFDPRQYRPFAPIRLTDRRWPDQVITKAPRWCAVDLRDGNQALVEPMTVEQKQRLFALLIRVGFKEIEMGFPAASQPDYDFVRWAIEHDRIPEGVSIQVLTQARTPLIERTFASLRGAKRAVVHLYNSTSRVQREKVFRLDPQGIIDIAVAGAREIKAQAEAYPDTDWTFEYSPESFSATELGFALEICEAVMEVWQPSAQRPMIINLPATVEMASPNVYADQIEWFSRHISHREAVILSLHTHNDRGCAVAAAELGVMAGADRVEGTLLGNGERTGNMDILTMGMNLYSQGIDPELDFSQMADILRTLTEVTGIAVHPRHPWAGELVYTAFSGSHQDAIRKCLSEHRDGDPWEVAYLPINPEDIGRSYQEVIRINSQSGKGGVAYVLERDHGLTLPRWMQIEFSQVVQRAAEQGASEISPEDIWRLFRATYMELDQPYEVLSYHIERHQQDEISLGIKGPQGPMTLKGKGQGALEALVDAIETAFAIHLEIANYSEQALSDGTTAEALTYVQLRSEGQIYSGVAIHRDTLVAVIEAVLVALNRIVCKRTGFPTRLVP